MSVTQPKGFQAIGVRAGIKKSGNPDLALVVNTGPIHSAAAVFTSNRFAAAPVIYSRSVLAEGQVKAVILNSGGANACTGELGYADTVQSANEVAQLLEIKPSEVAVCSTGLIGERLPMENIISGISLAVDGLSEVGGPDAAEAILTTDTVAKTAVFNRDGWSIGGMAKGAGMLAPGLATMLVVLTTDCDVSSADLQSALDAVVDVTFNRIDSDGCMSTNDTVLLLASGASGEIPKPAVFLEALTEVCASLSRQLISDAEGASKDIAIRVINSETSTDAVEVARAVSRSNLLKCAIHGEDPNWGRILSAAGTTTAAFDPGRVDVAINGVWICRGGGVGEDRNLVDLSQREVEIVIDLQAGSSQATVWTNDLTALYVHENSAYSS